MTTSISSQHPAQQEQPNGAAIVEDSASSTTAVQPKPTKSEVLACQFSSWYHNFRNISKSSLLHHHNTTRSSNETTTSTDTTINNANTKLRKNVTIESAIIKPLPKEFIEYLLSDGVRLPLCAGKVSSCLKDDTSNTAAAEDYDDGGNDNDNESDNDDDGWNDNSSNSDSQEPIPQYNFPTLTSRIHTTLTTLNNNKGCLPKLNWSSPKDATWMNCGSLKCTTVGDVYLLLKSSEFVSFDLERVWDDLDIEDAADDGSNTAADSADVNNDAAKGENEFEYELVLRKWCNLHPSMEFRCFIYNHELVAISQRHPTKFYSHLQLPSSKEDGDDDDNDEVQDQQQNPTYVETIQTFYKTYVQKRFANGKVHRYVMDVYVDSQERTWIVDFNVWATRTDGLLFDWEELMRIGQDRVSSERGDEGHDEPEVRVVTKDMKDLTYDPLSSFRGPTDVMSLMGGAGNNDDGGFEPSSFQNFMEQCVRPSEM